MENKELTLKTQPKWKSKYFWAALGSLVLLILGNWGLFEVVGLTSDAAKAIIDAALVAATALGVFNDSSDATNW